MSLLFDSHCHLTSEGLCEQVEAVLARAAAAGVGHCLTVAQDLADTAAALELAAHHPAVLVAAGIHPHLAAGLTDGWDRELLTYCRRPDIRAVGETGLDYHYDFSDRPSQHRVFRRQLEIAAETGKPVVIHCREAHEDVMTALSEFPALSGVVFHCYSGTAEQAQGLADRGYWISLTGVLTFKKADELRRVAAFFPADRIMIETDAPYLSPEPVRQVRPNEPALIVHTAARLAQVRGLEAAEAAALTTANARRFFGLAEIHGAQGR